jgi:hypothetical protein
MPPFPPEKISDTQAKKLYQYITKVLEKSKKQVGSEKGIFID